MDLIIDQFGHAILTIVERSTNMLFMKKLPHGKKSEPLAMQVWRLLLPNKEQIKTITTDNGPEFAAHKLITKHLGAVVYFADPYSSWQKGAIENTNKLIRQYIPKQANFDDYTDKRLQWYRRKSIIDPDRNSILKRPKMSSTKEYCNFALAGWLYIIRTINL